MSAATLGLVLLPLAAAALLALVPLPGRGRRPVALALAVAWGGLVLSAWITFGLSDDGAAGWRISGPWLPGLGGRFELAVDGIGLCGLLALAAGLWVAVAVDVHLDDEARSRPRLALAFAAAAGLALFLTARDLALAAAGHGLAGVALTGLLALGTARTADAAARRFGTWAAAGTLLLAAAAVAAGAAAGSTRIDDIAAAEGPVVPLAAALLGIALAMQVPLPPFHTWLAPVCAAGAGAGRVLILGGWCIAGLLGGVRTLTATAPLELSAVMPWPVWWGAATAAYGAVLALAPRPDRHGERLAFACMALGGIAAAGIVSLDAGAVVGGAVSAAAQAPLRALLVVLVAWTAQHGAGPRPALVWTAIALSLAAAPGGGVFPGWLAVVAGLRPAAPGLTVLLVLATTGVAAALLVTAVDLLRRPAAAGLPPTLTRLVVLLLLLGAASGLRPGPFMAGARPEVEAILSRTPDEPANDDGSEAGEEDAADTDAADDDAVLEPEGAP